MSSNNYFQNISDEILEELAVNVNSQWNSVCMYLNLNDSYANSMMRIGSTDMDKSKQFFKFLANGEMIDEQTQQESFVTVKQLHDALGEAEALSAQEYIKSKFKF